MSDTTVVARPRHTIALRSIKVGFASSVVLVWQMGVAAAEAQSAPASSAGSAPTSQRAVAGAPTAGSAPASQRAVVGAPTDSESTQTLAPPADSGSQQSMPANATSVESGRSEAHGQGDVAHPSKAVPVDSELAYAEPEIEQPAPSRFLATSQFTVRLELGGGGPFGEIIDNEERSTTVQGTYDDGSVQQGEISHGAIHFGANVEFAPLRKRKVKLAFRAGYLFTSYIQQATVGGGQYQTKTESAQLLRTHAALIGPVIYFGNRWFGSVQFMAGPIFGQLHPYPLAEKAGLIGSTDVGIDGWMFRLGPGLGYAFERWVLGADLLYSYSSFSFDDGITFEGSSNSDLNAIGMNLNAGMHF